MSKMDERAEMISASIVAQAEQESKELIRRANEAREKALRRFEDQIIQDMFARVQRQVADLRQETVRAASKTQEGARQGVLRRREELATQVFATVRARLYEYAKSPDYRQAMVAELAELANNTALGLDHSASTVYVREADADFGPEAQAILPGCAVAVDNTIKNGGWKLLNTAAGLLIDETLDTRLTEQVEWFLANSGLQIAES